MYKIIFGYCDINCHHYFDIIGMTRTRSKHEYRIRPKVARKNNFKYSFFHRYIIDWNSLPSEVMLSPSLQSFKVSLIKCHCLRKCSRGQKLWSTDLAETWHRSWL